MSDSKRQSIILTGVGLIIIGAIILGFALSQPKVAVSSLESDASVQSSQQTYDNEDVSLQTKSNLQNYDESNYSQSDSAKQNDQEASVSYPLNLNTCTAEELMTISGIGEVKASAIIEYREYLGGYTSVEQIKNIKVIGDKVYEKISPYLTV